MSVATVPSVPVAPPPGRARRSVPAAHRLGYVLVGLAAVAGAAAGAATWDTGWWPVLVFGALPDAAFLLALVPARVPTPGRGQLPRHVVPAYNALHHPLVPLALLAAGASGALGRLWLVAGLAWAAHVCLDRAAGYGLRGRDGWQRG